MSVQCELTRVKIPTDGWWWAEGTAFRLRDTKDRNEIVENYYLIGQLCDISGFKNKGKYGEIIKLCHRSSQFQKQQNPIYKTNLDQEPNNPKSQTQTTPVTKRAEPKCCLPRLPSTTCWQPLPTQAEAKSCVIKHPTLVFLTKCPKGEMHSTPSEQSISLQHRHPCSEGADASVQLKAVL